MRGPWGGDVTSSRLMDHLGRRREALGRALQRLDVAIIEVAREGNSVCEASRLG